MDKKPIIIIAILCVISLGLGYVYGKWRQGSGHENTQSSSGTKETPPKEPEFLKKGLVAYYPFNGNAKDESGNGHDGKVNGATSANDRHGDSNKAYSFDGMDDEILVDHKPELNAFPITVSTWVKFSDQQICVFLSKYLNRSFVGYFLVVRESGKVGFSFLNNHPSNGSVGGVLAHESLKSNDLSDGSWHQLVFSVDKIQGVLFVDGKKILAMPIDGVASKPNTNQPLRIGGGGFNGSIDDIRICNRALSEAEVKALYDFEKTKD